MSGFRVRSAEPIAERSFLRLEALEVEAPGGEIVARTVVRHPGAVVVVPVDSDERFALLVRQYRAAVAGSVLEVPAGKRDVDGEPPATTAARELEEELGLRAGRLVKLAEFFNTPGFCDEYTHLYAALDLTETGSTAPTSAEEREMTVERVPLAEIERLVAARELVDAKSIIGLLLARSLLAGAHTGIAGDV